MFIVASVGEDDCLADWVFSGEKGAQRIGRLGMPAEPELSAQNSG